jgi:hypothetical protein
LLAAVQLVFAVTCTVPVCDALVTDANVVLTATDGDAGSDGSTVTGRVTSNVNGLVPLHVFVGGWPTQVSVVLVRGP